MTKNKGYMCMKTGFTEALPFALCALYLCFGFVITKNATFFWDSISCFARPASFFYDSGLTQPFFTGQYDNGDPKFFQFVLAMVWTVCGRSMFVTRMFFAVPAIVSIACLCRIVQTEIEKTKGGHYPIVAILALTLLAIADPTVFTQILLPGADCILVCGFCVALLGRQTGKKLPMAVGLFLLCMANRRGMIVAACIMVADLLCEIANARYEADETEASRPKIRETILTTIQSRLTTYAPAVIAVLTYISIRFALYGWVFGSVHNEWNGSGDLASPLFMAKNTAIYVWRNADFGRIFLWVIIFSTIYRLGIKQAKEAVGVYLITLFAVLHIAFALVTIPLCNPFGARYFCPHFIVGGIIALRLLLVLDEKSAIGGGAFAGLMLLGGHLWIYPENISKNWDASLAHTPFYKLREDCLAMLREKEMGEGCTSGSFCLYGPQGAIFANDDRTYIGKEETPGNVYLLSNISNPKREDLERLSDPMTAHLYKRFESGGIYINVYVLNGEDAK